MIDLAFPKPPSEPDVPGGRWIRLRGLLRVVLTVVQGALAVGLMFGMGFHFELCWGLVLIYLAWLPWKPARALAAVVLVPAWVLAAGMGVLIAAGGPDSRGGPGPAIIVLAVLVAVAAAQIGLVVAELKTPPGPFPGPRGLLIHAAALAFIAWTFVQPADRRAGMNAAEAQWRAAQGPMQIPEGLSPEDRQFYVDNAGSLEHTRLLTPKQWRALEADTRTWVRGAAGRLPEARRRDFEGRWEAVFQQKEREQGFFWRAWQRRDKR